MRRTLCALLLVPLVAQAQQPVRGFPSDALAELARREAVLRRTPDTARLRAAMRAMASDQHHAGFPGSRRVAEWALQQFRSYGLEARLGTFQAPVPVSRRLEMLAPTSFVARLAEPPLDEDPDSRDEGQLPTYNAYSPDGDVTGELVYVNYGVPEDYAALARLGVGGRGRGGIARYRPTSPRLQPQTP